MAMMIVFIIVVQVIRGNVKVVPYSKRA